MGIRQRYLAFAVAAGAVAAFTAAMVAISQLGWSGTEWTALGAVATAAQAIGVIAALAIVWGRSAVTPTPAAVDRVLVLQATLIEGEIGAARSRLSTHLRDIAGGIGDATSGQRFRPTASELSNFGGCWGAYGLAVVNPDGARPAQDLNRLLWCFERIHAVLDHELADEALLHRLLSPHICWWHVALDNIENYQVLAFDSLDQLAEWVRTFRSQHPETEDYMRYVDLLVESLGDPVVRRVEDPDRG